MTELPQPLRPRRKTGWSTYRTVGTYRHTSGLIAISTVDMVNAPGSDDRPVPTWCLSVARHFVGRTNRVQSILDRTQDRPTNAEIAVTCEAFELTEWEEDNHYPGQARHLFIPVDPVLRGMCDCKITETVHVDPTGFAWTNPNEGEANPEVCRGCSFRDMALLMAAAVPCPIHDAPKD
jgi:hypothetical protein